MQHSAASCAMARRRALEGREDWPSPPRPCSGKAGQLKDKTVKRTGPFPSTFSCRASLGRHWPWPASGDGEPLDRCHVCPDKAGPLHDDRSDRRAQRLQFADDAFAILTVRLKRVQDGAWQTPLSPNAAPVVGGLIHQFHARRLPEYTSHVLT